MAPHFDAIRVGPYIVSVMDNVGCQPENAPLDGIEEGKRFGIDHLRSVFVSLDC